MSEATKPLFLSLSHAPLSAKEKFHTAERQVLLAKLILSDHVSKFKGMLLMQVFENTKSLKLEGLPCSTIPQSSISYEKMKA